MRPSKCFAGLIALVLVLAAGLAATEDKNTSVQAVPTARANTTLTSTPSSSDAAAITDIIAESYAVRVEGLKNFDTSRFSSVFVDDSSVPLTSEQADHLTKARARQESAIQATKGNGWLTYNIAQVVERQQSLAAQQQVQTAARVQGRQLTSEERQSVLDSNGQPLAPVIYEGNGKQKIVVLKLIISGSRADMEYDTGAITYGSVLIKTPAGWRIAGSKVLKNHF